MNIFRQRASICVIWAAVNFIISKGIKLITKKNHGIHIDFIGSIIKLSWLIIMVSMLTGMFKTTKTLSQTLLTSSGLLVAVAGFAAQEVLSDIISGIMLSWAKPFDIGEKINITELGISGIVESMSIRHTVIKTYHNSRLIIPNSVINKTVIENSNYDYIGNYLEIPVSYDSDMDKAVEIMEDVISNHHLVLDMRKDKEKDKKATVFIKELGENGIVLKSTIYTRNIDDNYIACSDIRKELKKQFDLAGIKMYFKRVRVIN